jgi:secreted trypsin-like serine protease
MCNGTILGVVSFGSGCGLIEYPGIYAALSPVRTWIFDITGV